MPFYNYRCDCGRDFEARQPVEERHYCPCLGCDRIAGRVFTPTAALVIPAHFRLPADWCLPDAGNREALERRQNPSQTHAPKQETFKDYFDKTYTGDL